ncbi:MAG TPA: biotin synthase BioB [Candidatus Dormibacteraeota bacterium]|jgi:biotin synthase|nr:biotin synthase BioB [Candidatus Dormibacteraeota bacterium]
MQDTLDRLVDAALDRREPNREDALLLLRSADDEVQRVVAAAYEVRRAYFGKRVKLNFLLNMKSGLCPEDCHYCSQRRDSTADILKYPMVDRAAAVDAASRAVSAGAKRLCMVASGRGPTDHELDQVTANVRAVKDAYPHLEICACLGLLADGQADSLKDAGVHAYNHNLNTSEKHYDEICGTHTYDDRVVTVGRAAAAGLSACSGALFGMGESDQDVVDLATDLRRLQPDSVPINFLIPIDGTPLAGRFELTPQKCLRILALFRFYFPDVEVRIAGGREVHLRSLQPLGLMIANSIFTGDYLTTEGQPASADMRMIDDLGFAVEGMEERTLPRERRDSDPAAAVIGSHPSPEELVKLRKRGAGTDLPANA